jgi:hypothetical protein
MANYLDCQLMTALQLANSPDDLRVFLNLIEEIKRAQTADRIEGTGSQHLNDLLERFMIENAEPTTDDLEDMEDLGAIQMTQELVIGAVLIQVQDEYTVQNFLLTPDEAAGLRDRLNNFDFEYEGDEEMNHSARLYKSFNLADGKGEPDVDREKFEAEHPGAREWYLDLLNAATGRGDSQEYS